MVVDSHFCFIVHHQYTKGHKCLLLFQHILSYCVIVCPEPWVLCVGYIEQLNALGLMALCAGMEIAHGGICCLILTVIDVRMC